MSIYRKLNRRSEHRTQFVFKCRREHKAKVNIPSMAYPNQYINVKIPHGSRDHIIALDILKITSDLDFESTDKTLSIDNNVSREPVKKKVLMHT